MTTQYVPILTFWKPIDGATIIDVYCIIHRIWKYILIEAFRAGFIICILSSLQIQVTSEKVELST